MDGRWLFDGAIVNPVPVSVARALGADRVIALNISSDRFGRGTAIQDPFGRAEPASTGEAPPHDTQRHDRPLVARQQRIDPLQWRGRGPWPHDFDGQRI